MPSELYKATNTKNGNLYVGVSSKGMEKRKRDHLNRAKRGDCYRFYNAIRKHGPEHFLFEVVAIFERHDDALEAERRLIAELRPTYNMTLGGQGALGYKHTKATLKMLRECKLGKPNPSLLGLKRSPEALARMSAAKRANPTRYWLGKKRSTETVAKIAATKAQRHYPVTDAAREAGRRNQKLASRALRKPVVCLSDGRLFESAAEADAAYGLRERSVAKVANPNAAGNSVFGLRFAYVEDRNAE